MWWQQQQTPSSLPPNFQPHPSFSTSHHTQPHHPSSQPSVLSYPPPAAYPTPELVHSSYYSPADASPVSAQPQWHGLPMESLPTARIPTLTGHMPSPAVAPKPLTTPTVHVDMTHQIGKGEAPTTPITLTPAGDSGTQYSTHTVSATVTNTPFSVDYLLHKPSASDSSSGQLSYNQQPLVLHPTEPYNQTGYSSHLEGYHQSGVPSQQMIPAPVSYPPHDGTPGLTGHGVLQGTQVVSVQEQLQPSQHHDKHMVSYSQGDTEEHYTDKMQPFQLYTVEAAVQQNSAEDGDNLALGLPPPEIPYSPPQLVPAEEESGPDELGSCSNVDKYVHLESTSPPPPPPPQRTSISQCQEAGHTSSSDMEEENCAQPFSGGGFQLAGSPLPNNAHPMVRTVSSHSSSSSGQESLHRPAHISTPPPLVPINPTIRQRKDSASEDDDDVFFPPPFGRRAVQEQQQEYEEEGGKEEEGEELRPPALKVSSPSEPLSQSSISGNSIAAGSVENSASTDKSLHSLPPPHHPPPPPSLPPPPPPPPLVIGRRGRGAGKVLDEEKLRIPITRGYVCTHVHCTYIHVHVNTCVATFSFDDYYYST